MRPLYNLCTSNPVTFEGLTEQLEQGEIIIAVWQRRQFSNTVERKVRSAAELEAVLKMHAEGNNTAIRFYAVPDRSQA